MKEEKMNNWYGSNHCNNGADGLKNSQVKIRIAASGNSLK